MTAQKVDDGEVGVAGVVDVGHGGKDASADRVSLHELAEGKPDKSYPPDMSNSEILGPMSMIFMSQCAVRTLSVSMTTGQQ